MSDTEAGMAVGAAAFARLLVCKTMRYFRLRWLWPARRSHKTWAGMPIQRRVKQKPLPWIPGT